MQGGELGQLPLEHVPLTAAKVPVWHSWHEELPLALAKVPDGHLSHAVLPSNDEYVPGSQGVQEKEPSKTDEGTRKHIDSPMQ